MPDEFSPNFEQVLEADMRRLAAEVKLHREAPENKEVGDREIIKKSLQSISQNSRSSQNDVSQSPLPNYISEASSETKLEVEYLLDLVFHKGLEAAFKEAQKSNPFVLDAFHDALAGKLYPELQKRGILK